MVPGPMAEAKGFGHAMGPQAQRWVAASLGMGTEGRQQPGAGG